MPQRTATLKMVVMRCFETCLKGLKSHIPSNTDPQMVGKQEHLLKSKRVQF